MDSHYPRGTCENVVYHSHVTIQTILTSYLRPVPEECFGDAMNYDCTRARDLLSFDRNSMYTYMANLWMLYLHHVNQSCKTKNLRVQKQAEKLKSREMKEG